MTEKQPSNPGKKYFEDVFNPIIVYWKKRYYFSKRNDTDSMVCSLGKHFNEIEYEVDVNNFGKYNDWQSAMIFIIYSVATDYALNFQKNPDRSYYRTFLSQHLKTNLLKTSNPSIMTNNFTMNMRIL